MAVDSLMEVLTTFDVLGSDGGLSFSPHRNLLADVVSRCVGDTHVLVHCQMWRPEGKGLEKFQQQSLIIPGDERLDMQQVLLWDVCRPMPPVGTKVWLLNLRDPIVVPGINDLVLCFHEGSVWMPALDSLTDDLDDSPLHVLELFSGGFGGWKSACDFIQGHSGTSFQVVGLDHDFDACAQYAATFHANMLSLQQELNLDLLKQSEEHWVLHGSVEDSHWLPMIARWNPHLITISSPCPPWSNASHAHGVLKTEGMLLVKAIMLCRWLRPAAILLEQVPGFNQHEQKPLVLQCLHQIGFRLVFQKVLNVADCSLVQRPRWLGLALRIHGDSQPFVFHPWLKSENVTQLKNFRLPLSREERALLQLSSEALRVATNPEFLKNARTQATTDQVFRSRVYQPGQMFPTFMATYGFQHELPVEHLKKFGYYGHFLSDWESDLGCRFMSPFEILLLHGITHSCFLENDLACAWRTVGNFITVQHALILLANACNCVGPEKLDVQLLFKQFLAERFTAENAKCHELTAGSILMHVTASKSDSFLAAVEQLFESRFAFGIDHFCWSPETGFQLGADPCEIPDTQLTDSQQVAKCNAFMSQISVDELMALEEVSATMLWAPVSKGLIHLQQADLTFWFSADLTLDELTCLWGGNYACEFHACDSAGYSATLTATTNVCDDLEAFHRPLVMFMTEGKLTILPGAEATPLLALPYFQDGIGPLWQPYAKVFDGELPVACRIYLTSEIKLGQFDAFPAVIMASIKNTSGVWSWDPATDKLILQLQGDDFSVKTMLKFWSQVLVTSTLKDLGRKSEIHGDALHFVPLADNVPCPQFAFREALSVSATRCLLNNLAGNLRDFTDVLIPVQVKWTSFICDQQLPSQITVEVLLTLLEYGFSPSIGAAHFRPLVLGKSVAYATILKDLPIKEGRDALRVDLVLSLQGGGPSKSQQRALHENVIAGLFLEQGYDLDWTSKAVATLVEKCGITKLQSVSASPMGTAKLQALDKLCTEAGLVKPVITAPTTKKQFAGAPWNSKKKKVGNNQIDVHDYRIDDGFFFNQDDTPAVQLPELHAQKNGVVLAAFEDARSWLLAGELISSDELGLLVVGPKPVQCQMVSQACVIPCHTSRGQAVLLSAQLYQFGTKKIKVKQSDPKDQIKNDQAQLMAVTFFKGDWAMEDWQKILHETPKFLRSQMQAEQLDGSIQASWGKAFRDNRTPASPIQAQSVQLHAMVVADKVDEVLKKSGFNRIYFTPKLPSGKLSEDFKVLWSSGDRTALEVLSAKLPSCLGLVRSRTNMGLRVKATDFAAAWAIVNPNSPVPQRDAGDLLYKVAGLPFGCSLAMLEAWLTNLKWNAKPLKAIGAQAWLIRAVDRPPEGHLLFNSSPVLLSFLPPKQETTRAVLAGPPPRPRVQGTKSYGVTDEWPQGDPWQNWQGSSTATASAAPVTRQTEGPTTVRLQAQDAKIEALQQQFTQMTEQHKQLETGMMQRIDVIEKQGSDHRVFVEKSLQSLRGDMDQALQQSLTKTAQLMDNKFEDLKALFGARAAKRPSDDDAPMDTK